jgi:hypothetical protein
MKTATLAIVEVIKRGGLPVDTSSKKRGSKNRVPKNKRCRVG